MTHAHNSAVSPWRRALEFYAEGRLHLAHRALHQHLGEQPDCGRGWELLGMVYYVWRQFPPARNALEQATALVPLQPAAECALADCYLACGQRELAHLMYRHLLQRDEVDADVLLAVAAGLDQVGESRGAVAACRRAIFLDGAMSQAYYDLSFYLGRSFAPPDIVEAAAQRAVLLDPDNITYRIGLAGFLQGQSRSREAARLLEPLAAEQVLAMNCRCCLARLIAIFEAVDDQERAAWCRSRQEALLLSGSQLEC